MPCGRVCLSGLRTIHRPPALGDLPHYPARECVAYRRRRIRCCCLQRVAIAEWPVITGAGHDHHRFVAEGAKGNDSHTIAGLQRGVSSLNEKLETDAGVQLPEMLNASDIDTAE